jgi:hypothetical protein
MCFISKILCVCQFSSRKFFYGSLLIRTHYVFMQFILHFLANDLLCIFKQLILHLLLNTYACILSFVNRIHI